MPNSYYNLLTCVSQIKTGGLSNHHLRARAELWFPRERLRFLVLGWLDNKFVEFGHLCLEFSNLFFQSRVFIFELRDPSLIPFSPGSFHRPLLTVLPIILSLIRGPPLKKILDSSPRMGIPIVSCCFVSGCVDQPNWKTRAQGPERSRKGKV